MQEEDLSTLYNGCVLYHIHSDPDRNYPDSLGIGAADDVIGNGIGYSHDDLGCILDLNLCSDLIRCPVCHSYPAGHLVFQIFHSMIPIH